MGSELSALADLAGYTRSCILAVLARSHRRILTAQGVPHPDCLEALRPHVRAMRDAIQALEALETLLTLSPPAELPEDGA